MCRLKHWHQVNIELLLSMGCHFLSFLWGPQNKEIKCLVKYKFYDECNIITINSNNEEGSSHWNWCQWKLIHMTKNSGHGNFGN